MVLNSMVFFLNKLSFRIQVALPQHFEKVFVPFMICTTQPVGPPTLDDNPSAVCSDEKTPSIRPRIWFGVLLSSPKSPGERPPPRHIHA